MKNIFLNELEHMLLIGHRGFAGTFPENTMESFRKALSIDTQCVLEMDLRLTKDNKVVVFHDSTLNRTTNSSGPVRDKTYEELQKLDAGYNFTTDEGKTFPYRDKGIKIPLIEDILKEFPEARLIIDIKEPGLEFAEQVMDIIQKHKAVPRVCVGSFIDKTLKNIRKKFPGTITGFGRNEIIKFIIFNFFHLMKFFKNKGDIIIVSEFTKSDKPELIDNGKGQGYRVITPGFIKAAHKFGLPVYVWTVDREENMIRLIRWGIDGIITNIPDKLKEVMIQEGQIK